MFKQELGELKDYQALIHVDDILISGSSEQENVERLQIVLSRLSEVGLRLKKENCVFGNSS